MQPEEWMERQTKIRELAKRGLYVMYLMRTMDGRHVAMVSCSTCVHERIYGATFGEAIANAIAVAEQLLAERERRAA